MIPDRKGFFYANLVDTQTKQLWHWDMRIIAEFRKPIRDYVTARNKPAANSEGVHKVWRGQDIVDIIYNWPHTAPCYPTTPFDLEAEEVI